MEILEGKCYGSKIYGWNVNGVKSVKGWNVKECLVGDEKIMGSRYILNKLDL